MSNPITAKTFENKFNEVWGKYLYAVFADIESEMETTGPAKYSPYLYQSYKNLTSENKVEKLKGRFTISDVVRQYLTYLFGKMITELKDIDLTEKDNHESLMIKVRDETEDKYTYFMFSLGSQHKNNHGKTLKEVNDPTMWFLAQIAGLLPNHVTNQMIIALISNEFNIFLKSLAWLVGQFLHENDTSTIPPEMFRGLLATVGMTRLQRDLMTSSLREKAPAKSRAKKSSKESTPTDFAVDVQKPVVVENKPVNQNTPLVDDDLTNLLGDI